MICHFGKARRPTSASSLWGQQRPYVTKPLRKSEDQILRTGLAIPVPGRCLVLRPDCSIGTTGEISGSRRQTESDARHFAPRAPARLVGPAAPRRGPLIRSPHDVSEHGIHAFVSFFARAATARSIRFSSYPTRRTVSAPRICDSIKTSPPGSHVTPSPEPTGAMRSIRSGNGISPRPTKRCRRCYADDAGCQRSEEEFRSSGVTERSPLAALRPPAQTASRRDANLDRAKCRAHIFRRRLITPKPKRAAASKVSDAGSGTRVRLVTVPLKPGSAAKAPPIARAAA